MKNGVAKIKFEFMDLVDSDGNPVLTGVNWVEIKVKTTGQNGSRLKAAIT
jgi:hypothetical protein